jgi:general L-amino acid transport system permease protein
VTRSSQLPTSAAGDAPARPTFAEMIYSKGFRSVVYQLLLALLVVAAGYYLYSNVTANLRAQNIATGFGFLGQSAQFQIGQTTIEYSPTDNYARALLVGLVNTLFVSVCGIFLATIVGFTVGISRVSGNWLLMKVATAYVEVVRNVPVVLQVIFFAVLLRNLPVVREAIDVFGFGMLSNRGLSIAVPVAHPIHGWMLGGLAAGIALAVLFSMWARRRRDATGQHLETIWINLALILGIPVLIWLAGGAPAEVSVPSLQGFRIAGGMTLSPEFAALLIGISTYSSGFIAEIVRAGIQATPKGQIEAATSIGLRPRFVMSHIILPQALRVIVPPLTSQYVNVMKNSSIAVVIGYPDLVSIGNTMMNQTGQAVEAIALMMLVYLTISLVTSGLMNLYNRAVAIKER